MLETKDVRNTFHSSDVFWALERVTEAKARSRAFSFFHLQLRAHILSVHDEEANLHDWG